MINADQVPRDAGQAGVRPIRPASDRPPPREVFLRSSSFRLVQLFGRGSGFVPRATAKGGRSPARSASDGVRASPSPSRSGLLLHRTPNRPIAEAPPPRPARQGSCPWRSAPIAVPGRRRLLSMPGGKTSRVRLCLGWFSFAGHSHLGRARSWPAGRRESSPWRSARSPPRNEVVYCRAKEVRHRVVGLVLPGVALRLSPASPGRRFFDM